jgi:hypothetical protein
MGQQIVSSPPIKQPKGPLAPKPPTGTPQATTVTYPLPRMSKTDEKGCLCIFASISFHSTHKCTLWASKSIWQSNDATHGVHYPHDPTQLPHRPL